MVRVGSSHPSSLLIDEPLLLVLSCIPHFPPVVPSMRQVSQLNHASIGHIPGLEMDEL